MGASLRILVPTRGSLPTIRACRIAATMLPAASAEVRLFTVTERTASDAREPPTRVADPALAELGRVFEQAGHLVDVCARVGDAPAEILREIDAWSPDLVVMGRWRARVMERWMHGAVFDRVLRHVHVPVLVAAYDPERAGGADSIASESSAVSLEGNRLEGNRLEGILRVLVPTRGSEWAIRASRVAARMLPPGRAEVRLLTVLPEEAYPMPYTIEGKRVPDLPERVLRMQEAAELAVDGTRSVFEHAGHPVGVHHRFGPPPAEILSEIADWAPDLVVLGRWHGMSAPEWVPGSIFERVLRHSSVPALVAK